MLTCNSNTRKGSNLTSLVNLHDDLLDAFLRHRVFRALDLVSAAQLKNLDMLSNKQELLLREELDHELLFRWVNERQPSVVNPEASTGDAGSAVSPQENLRT